MCHSTCITMMYVDNVTGMLLKSVFHALKIPHSHACPQKSQDGRLLKSSPNPVIKCFKFILGKGNLITWLKEFLIESDRQG